MTVNEKIRDLRIQKKWTQKQLANRAGIAIITLQQYELGKRIPKTSQLVKIANAFSVPINYFLTDWEDLLNEETYKTSEKERIEIYNEKALLRSYHRLNETGKKEAQKRVDELTEISRFTTEEIESLDNYKAYIKDKTPEYWGNLRQSLETISSCNTNTDSKVKEPEPHRRDDPEIGDDFDPSL